jgi:hypothetical protein
LQISFRDASNLAILDLELTDIELDLHYDRLARVEAQTTEILTLIYQISFELLNLYTQTKLVCGNKAS